jgi:hypothetical protein
MQKLTVAALALAFAPVAFSEGVQSPTRASVKAETRSLEKAGRLTPAGEGALGESNKDFKSTLTRAQRKADTRLAARNHQLTPAGSAGSWRADNALRAQPTRRSRSERKAETRLAEKQRKLIPAGEGSDAPKR